MTDTSKALELAEWIGSLTWSDQTPYVRKRLIATVEELIRLAAIEQEYERIRSLEPVAQIKGTEQYAFPLLEWLSADHSFRAPIGSMLYTLPPNLKG